MRVRFRLVGLMGPISEPTFTDGGKIAKFTDIHPPSRFNHLFHNVRELFLLLFTFLSTHSLVEYSRELQLPQSRE